MAGSRLDAERLSRVLASLRKAWGDGPQPRVTGASAGELAAGGDAKAGGGQTNEGQGREAKHKGGRDGRGRSLGFEETAEPTEMPGADPLMEHAGLSESSNGLPEAWPNGVVSSGLGGSSAGVLYSGLLDRSQERAERGRAGGYGVGYGHEGGALTVSGRTGSVGGSPSGKSGGGRAAPVESAGGPTSEASSPQDDPLNHLLKATLVEGTTESRATGAFRRLRDVFVDWNELRVATTEDVQETVGHLPASRSKVEAIRSYLNAIFESRNVMSLEFLRERPKREARSYLEGLEGVSPAAAAAVMLWGLSGHAIPVDTSVARVLVRLGLFDASTPPEQMQAALERGVPARESAQVAWVLRRHADETCLAENPHCKSCVLTSRCPASGKAVKAMPSLKAKGQSRGGQATPGHAPVAPAIPGQAKPGKSGKASPTHAKSVKAGKASPAKVTSVQAKPGQAKPGKSGKVSPTQAKPGQTKPGKASPAKVASVKAKPGQAKPGKSGKAVAAKVTPGKAAKSPASGKARPSR